MIEHVVALRFRERVPPEDRQSLLEELQRLPERFAGMIDFRIGENRSSRDDTFSHAFTVRFLDWDSLNEYLSSEAHESFVADRFRPLVAQRAIVSFEY